MIRKAVVLAAGAGTRVRPLTRIWPKPMLPILDRPVIDLLLGYLRRHGIEQVYINLSHLGERLQEHVGDGARFGLKIDYSIEGREVAGRFEPAPLGSAAGLRQIQASTAGLDETFVVVCGDVIVDLNLTAAVERHRACGAIATVLTRHVPAAEIDRFGIAEVDAAGKVRRFIEKPQPGVTHGDLANIGVYIFEPAVLDSVPASGQFDIGGDLLPALVDSRQPLYADAPPLAYHDIGTLADYHDTLCTAIEGRLPHYTPPGTLVSPGLFVAESARVEVRGAQIAPPAVIAEQTVVEPGAKIVGPVALLRGCHIQSGAVIKNSVVGPYTKVGARARVEDQLVYGEWVVDVEQRSTRRGAPELGWHQSPHADHGLLKRAIRQMEGLEEADQAA